MIIRKNIRCVFILLIFLQVTYVHAQNEIVQKNNEETDVSIIQRISSYKQSVEGDIDGIHTNMYIRNYFQTKKRNFSLMMMPSMYYISRGNRENVWESYNKIFIHGKNIKDVQSQISISTIPHNRGAMSVLIKYLMPNIYEVTMVENQLLSPINEHNIELYRYTITYLTDNRVEIVFRPRRYNTQLVSGSAIVERSTGRVIKIKFNGEYDMIDFHVEAYMGTYGIRSLMPKTCNIDARFHFLGNKISTTFCAVYDNPINLADTAKFSRDLSLMSELRPIPLPTHIQDLYKSYLNKKSDTIYTEVDDSVIPTKRKRRWDKFLWDVVGDNLITRIKGRFGNSNQGSFRISPILNPISLSYSKRKGVIYKLRIRSNYDFSENSNFTLNFKGSYSFKQHQFYYNIPLRYTFNKKKNGYAEIEIGNGNRITNSNIVEQIKHERFDSIDWDKMNLDYFKDRYIKARINYDASPYFGIQPGLIFHKRSAVDKQGFLLAKRPIDYYSFSPSMQLQFRPFGWDGLILTADYERGIKGVGKADMQYERIEFDASWRKRLRSLRQLSMRCGSGFYTTKNKTSYFLDYVNFREENIPGGWNDDWTGEFQLLNSNWYNASEYYVRTNITYESPLLLLSRIPYIGRLIEIERIYLNTLYVEQLHPYLEAGYGFTNRFFSMGLFVASSNRSFEGFGCRFGFELFRDW